MFIGLRVANVSERRRSCQEVLFVRKSFEIGVGSGELATDPRSVKSLRAFEYSSNDSVVLRDVWSMRKACGFPKIFLFSSARNHGPDEQHVGDDGEIVRTWRQLFTTLTAVSVA